MTTNSTTLYSVEYKPKTNPLPNFPMAWGQYVLTHTKWRARMYHLELRLSMGRKNHTRIREV